MNKRKLISELKSTGVKVIELGFYPAGYLIELKLSPTNHSGWEEFEDKAYDGFEIIRMRHVSMHVRHVILIPTIRKEFNDYLRRHTKEYGTSRYVALKDLELLISESGSVDAKSNFKNYIESIKR